MKEKIIYSKKLAFQLRKLGFQIIRLDTNRNLTPIALDSLLGSR